MSPFFIPSDVTFPATSPNLIAYLIPSNTSGFACPAESPTRMTLSYTVFLDNPSFGINP